MISPSTQSAPLPTISTPYLTKRTTQTPWTLHKEWIGTRWTSSTHHSLCRSNTAPSLREQEYKPHHLMCKRLLEGIRMLQMIHQWLITTIIVPNRALWARSWKTERVPYRRRCLLSRDWAVTKSNNDLGINSSLQEHLLKRKDWYKHMSFRNRCL